MDDYKYLEISKPELEYRIMIALEKIAKSLENYDRKTEPKRGEWVDMGDFEQCSVCKGTHLKEFQSYYGKTTWIKTPYCPYCGAKMADRKTEPQTERSE